MEELYVLLILLVFDRILARIERMMSKKAKKSIATSPIDAMDFL